MLRVINREEKSERDFFICVNKRKRGKFGIYHMSKL